MAASVETTTSSGLQERQRVVDVLRRHEGELRSTARGDVRPQSDVDLLIEVDPLAEDRGHRQRAAP